MCVGVCVRVSVRVFVSLGRPYHWGHPKPEFITIYVINYSRRVHVEYVHTSRVYVVVAGTLDDDACWRGANPVDVARICSSQMPSHSSSLNTRTHKHTSPSSHRICHPHINGSPSFVIADSRRSRTGLGGWVVMIRVCFFSLYFDEFSAV